MQGRNHHSEHDLYDVIGTLYEAATEPQLWRPAIQKIIDFVGSSGSHVWLMDDGRKEVVESIHVGMPDLLIEEYNGDKVKTCPRFENARHQPLGQLLYDYQHIDETRIDSDEYYDWLQRTGDGIRYYLAVGFRGERGLTGFQSLAFRRSEGHSQPEHWLRFQRVIPHLQRAMRLAQQVGGWRQVAQSALATLEQLDFAVAFVDARRTLLGANPDFEALLQEPGWFRVRQNAIELRTSSLQNRFHALVRAAANTTEGRGVSPGGDLLLQFNGRCCKLCVSPLRDAPGGLGPRSATVALIVTRPERPITLDRRFLMQKFSLTPAELRLAVLLTQGETLKGSARQLNRSIHTVRAQLKALFAKTDTHRQADLVRVLLASGLAASGPKH